MLPLLLLTTVPFAAAATGVELLPNGGFEWVEYPPAEWVAQVQPRMPLPAIEQGLPVTWRLLPAGMVSIISEEGHARAGQRGLFLDGREHQGVGVECGWIEVAPRQSYSLVLWGRGAGELVALVRMVVPEGERRHELGRFTLGEGWHRFTAEIDFPGNVKRIALVLQAARDAQVVVDEVSLTTDGPSYAPGLPPVSPLQADSETTFLASYDEDFGSTAVPSGDPPRLGAPEARFGQALFLGQQQNVTYLNRQVVNPTEGTVEFWLRVGWQPYERGSARYLWYCSAQGGGVGLMRMGQGSLGLATGRPGYRPAGSALIPPDDQLLLRMSPRDWHHVAGTWQPDGTLRMYLDGMLLAIDENAQPFEGMPSTFLVGPIPSDNNAYNVYLDDLRVSKVARYGLPAASRVPAPPRRREHEFASVPAGYLLRWPERARFAETAGAFTLKPDLQARYIIEGQDLRLLDPTSDAGFTPSPASGLAEGVSFHSVTRPGDRVYWTVPQIPAGRYYVSIQLKSGQGPAPAGYLMHPNYHCYLNGDRLFFSSATLPIPIGGGAYAAEMQGREALVLKPGDRITIHCLQAGPLYGRLLLSPHEPERGPLVLGRHYESDVVSYVERWLSEMRLEQDSAARGRAFASLRNVAGRPLGMQLRLQVVDHFQRVLAQEERELKLGDLGQVSLIADFPLGTSHRYRADLDVTDETGYTLRTSRFLMGDVTQGARRMWLLNGEWDLQKQPDQPDLTYPPQGEGEWSRHPVPGVVNVGSQDAPEKTTHAFWYRRVLTPPEWLRGQRYVMSFEQVSDYCEVWVNGHRCGEHMGGRTPFEVDVTAALRPGEENEVLVGVQDWSRLLAPEARQDTDLAYPQFPARFISPATMAWGWRNTTCGIRGDVWLEARSAVSVGNVAVRPSLGGRRMEVELSLANRHRAAARVTVQNTVYDREGKIVLRLPEQTVPVPPGEEAQLKVEAPWHNPHPWTPADPYLHELRTEVRAEGLPGDVLSTRFGVRDLEVREGQLRFNGKRLVLLGNQALGGSADRRQECYELMYWMRRLGTNFARLGGTSLTSMDLADEVGLLVQAAVAGVGSVNQYVLESDEYWENAEATAHAALLAFRNHAAAVVWEPSNEFWCFSAYQNTPGGQSLSAERLSRLGRFIQSLDDRPIHFDGDSDLGGIWDTYSLHYSQDSRLHAVDQSFWLPNLAYYRDLSQPWRKGQELSIGRPGGGHHPPVGFGEKPIFMGEIGLYGFTMPVFATYLAGDRAYGDGFPGYETLDRVIMDGARDVEAAILNVWESFRWLGPPHASLPAIALDILDESGHFYSGERVTKRVNLFHDVFMPQRLTLVWQLSGEREQRQTWQAEQHEIKRWEVRFTAPRVARPERRELRVAILRGQEVLAEKIIPLTILPGPVRPPELTRRVGLFDRSGRTAETLEGWGLRLRRVEALTAEELGELEVVVLGYHTVDETLMPHATVLQEFVARGGRVICLEQDRLPQWLPLQLEFRPARISSICFPRVPEHPILTGLTEENLRYWRPDHAVSRGDYRKPRAGCFLPLVDAGSPDGLVFSPLLEIYHGRGSYVLSQFRLIESFDREPAARLLMRNLLEYAQGPLFRQPVPVAFALLPASEMPALFERLRVDMPSIAAGEAGTQRVVLADGRAEYGPEEREALVAYARSGGTLWLHNLQPTTAQDWSAALEREILLRPPGTSLYSGRMLRTPRDPLWIGLSLDDTYWHLRTAYYAGWAESYRLDHLVEYEIVPTQGVSVSGAPPAWARLAVGQGSVIVDQLRWSQANEKTRDLGDRLASILLTAAGASFRPVPLQRSLPRGLQYHPVSLADFVNRSVADEEDNDGQDGWTDQGRQTDLRDFVPGRHTFHGVPVEVVEGENNVVVLQGMQRQLGVPQAVEGIALGRTAQALYFLQSGAWIGEGVHHASYWVTYADGSRQEIKLVGGINYRDWASPSPEAPFQAEVETRTRVAWTGSCPSFPVTSVYLMEWVNPYPEKVLESLDFVSNVQGVPILMGLTVADLPEGHDPGAQPTGDRARAEQLLGEGDALLREGQLEAALARFREATGADRGYYPPFVRVAQALQQLNRPEEAERAYLRALEVNPHSTEACNSLAELYRGQGELEKALRMYRRSLDINWNQPPAREAVDALEQELLKR